MRALAMTGMVTVSWMPRIISGSLIRATPPSRRMSAGARSGAMNAGGPAPPAVLVVSGVGGAAPEAMAGGGARVLGDLRVLGVDDVHDHAALEHLGQAGLDAECGLVPHLTPI